MTLRLRSGDTSIRTRPSAEAIRDFLPATGAVGPFRFPEPYGTQGVRLTNASDGAIEPAGYSYWSNANNHAGQDEVLVALGRGEAPGLLVAVDKATLRVSRRELPMSGTGEGWRFSRTLPFALYVAEGPVLSRLDVRDFHREAALDLRALGRGGEVLWQTHSSGDDRVHSGTLRDASTYATKGAFAYDEATGRLLEVQVGPGYDECQVDKSGRFLLVKEGADVRIVDLETGASSWLTDLQGAPGHSDCGYGAVVGEDDREREAGSFRLWLLEPGGGVSDGRVAYHMWGWVEMARHVSWTHARPGEAASQRALVSSAHRGDLPRANELVLASLDGSLECEVVAPNLVDLDAPGGGSDYRKLPKANVDPAGEWAVWTANCGTGRLDAFMVRLPDPQGPSGPTPDTLPPRDQEATVNGQIARHPYPSEDMTDAISVVPGSPLVLVKADPLIQTQDPSTGNYRPSAAGDVLTRTPGRVWEGRPPGSNGSWEQYAVNGALAVFNPLGDPAASESFVFWPQVPNL